MDSRLQKQLSGYLIQKKERGNPLSFLAQHYNNSIKEK